MKLRALGAAVGLCLATPALADDDPYPRFYPGASVGGHLVLADWSFGELDEFSRPVNAETSLITALRLGVDLSEAWAVELSGAHLPFDASAETNDGLDIAARARWTFAPGGIAPFLMAGLGAYINPQPDPDTADAEIQPQVHYGIGLGPQLGDHVRLRLDVRHMIAFGDETGHNLVAMGGLDLFFGGEEPPPPNPDRDGDGILNADDKCPDDPEDKDGVADVDGCPEDDADGDGILDAADKCPTDPEDKDGVADEDGCPEDDADGDGILDAADKCPLEPETKNDFEDADGCPESKPEPRVQVTCTAIEFGEMVFFDLERYTLRAEAKPVLDEIAETMKDRGDLKRVRISGFADATGSTAFNARLSQQRAQAVRQALVARGVAKGRLEVVALGESKPRASNATEQGRAQNRRVEFTITQRDADATCPPK